MTVFVQLLQVHWVGERIRTLDGGGCTTQNLYHPRCETAAE
jgi:hypothetical protein